MNIQCNDDIYIQFPHSFVDPHPRAAGRARVYTTYMYARQCDFRAAGLRINWPLFRAETAETLCAKRGGMADHLY